LSWFTKEEHKKVIRYGDKTVLVDVTQAKEEVAKEPRELMREEQMEPKRVHPWQTPRGKKFIDSMKTGVKKLDRKIVNYNRRYNPHRGGGNFNPWGSTFDRGMVSMQKPRSSKSKTKYAVVGGKAYPIAGTGKKKTGKKKTKRSSSGAFSFDFGSW